MHQCQGRAFSRMRFDNCVVTYLENNEKQKEEQRLQCSENMWKSYECDLDCSKLTKKPHNAKAFKGIQRL